MGVLNQLLLWEQPTRHLALMEIFITAFPIMLQSKEDSEEEAGSLWMRIYFFRIFNIKKIRYLEEGRPILPT